MGATATAESTAFWASAGMGNVGRKGPLYYVVMPITARMEIITRKGEESFQDAVVKHNGVCPSRARLTAHSTTSR